MRAIHHQPIPFLFADSFGIERRVIAAMDALMAWHQRVRERRMLLAMDGRMLSDLGIGQADAWGEASKPFWRN